MIDLKLCDEKCLKLFFLKDKEKKAGKPGACGKKRRKPLITSEWGLNGNIMGNNLKMMIMFTSWARNKM